VTFMTGPAALRLRALRAAARHPQVVDAVLGAVFATLSLVAVVVGPPDDDHPGGRGDLAGRDITTVDVVAAVLAFGFIAARRRWPLPVLAAATVAAIWAIATGGLAPALVGAAVICCYTVATLTNRTTAWVAGACVALSGYAANVYWSDFNWADPESAGIFAWTGMAVAVGDALRTRRAYVAAVEERARRAEQSRDAEAQRRVIEERLRIARELHDVVAHHIAMINVQAGVAAHLLRGQPDKAEEALGHVRHAARTVLDELSTVLGVLRQLDDPEVATEPTRGLGRLTELLDSMAAAGLRVEHRQDGPARALPSSVDLAAFRIIQESLTNAQKHGGDTARLRLRYTPDAVTVDVHNPINGVSPVGSGHGIVGMRERAAAVGGTLRIGPGPDGHFTVHAELPAPGGAAADKGAR
jgi:signal transduction histidine kinase